MKGYLSVCAIYKNEARYLAEWLEFHLLAGVEHFFLYDNNSTDDHREVLAPYLRAGVVTAHGLAPVPGLRSPPTTIASKRTGTTGAGSRSSTWTSSSSRRAWRRCRRCWPATSTSRGGGPVDDLRHLGPQDPPARAGDRELHLAPDLAATAYGSGRASSTRAARGARAPRTMFRYTDPGCETGAGVRLARRPAPEPLHHEVRAGAEGEARGARGGHRRLARGAHRGPAANRSAMRRGDDPAVCAGPAGRARCPWDQHRGRPPGERRRV